MGIMETTNLDTIYGSPQLDWGSIEGRLDAGVSQAPDTGGPNRHTCWLATINRDGSPHLTGVGALWADGTFWFETGGDTRKGRNLARDPRCTLSSPPRSSTSWSRAKPAGSPTGPRSRPWPPVGPPRAGRPASTTPAGR